MFKVISLFTDLTDNNHLYKVGDIYPREGLTPSAERIKELSTSTNRRGTALIEEVRAKAETAKPDAVEPEQAEPVESAPKKRGRKSAAK